MVVSDVGALRRSHTLRDPPKPEQSNHMIDTQPSGMPQDRGNHLSERRVSGSGEPIRPPGWLIPGLALLVEGIRWAANRDVSCVCVLQAPRVHSTRTHTNGKIMHHAKCHACAQSRLLSAGQLLIQQPLQPAVEIDL